MIDTEFKVVIEKAERSLAYALRKSMGLNLKPLVHRGTENKDDLAALATLAELRQILGIRTASSPSGEAVTKSLEDL